MQEPSCKWPSCQTEQYQNDLADHIAKELIGEQPRKAVKLSEAEVHEIYDKWVLGTPDGTTFTDVFEQAVWAKLGVEK